MPRAKSLAHYPARYGEIVEATAVRNEQIDVVLPDLGSCRKLRGHYYAYKGALMRASEILQARTSVPSAGEEEIIERSKLSEMVIVTILDDPPTVRFENRENSWQAQALATASSTAGLSKPTSTGLDEIAARLAAIKPDNGDTQ